MRAETPPVGHADSPDAFPRAHRYMNYAGCLRKFDVAKFCARYPAAIEAAQKIQSTTQPNGEGPVPMKAAAGKEGGAEKGGEGGKAGKGKLKQ